ncbi:MAG: hypothetical protein WCS27_17035 [Victivallaceae bacterium]
MIRRSWVIYRRKSRRIISVVFHFRKDALRDLKRLNDYYGRRHYAMQLTKTDTETGKIVSKYPDVDLQELPKQEAEYG